MKDPLATALGIPDRVDPKSPVNSEGFVEAPKNLIEADYDFVRDNLYNIANKSNEAITDLVDIAVKSQDHNLYNALAKMIDASTKANAQLAKLAQEDPRNKKPIEVTPANVTNNTLNIIGNDKPRTSAARMSDILNMIASAKESAARIIDGVDDEEGDIIEAELKNVN